jgi:hypothetical protein
MIMEPDSVGSAGSMEKLGDQCQVVYVGLQLEWDKGGRGRGDPPLTNTNTQTILPIHVDP